MALLAFLVLVALLAVGFLNAPRDSTGKRPILSSYVIVLLGATLYIAFPAALVLYSGTYTWAPNYYTEEAFARTLWICSIAVITFVYGNALLRGRRSIKHGRHEAIEPSNEILSARNRTVDLLLWLFLFVGIIMKVILVVNTGGIADAVTRFSGYARESTGIETLDAGSVLLRTLSGAADGAAVYGVLRALRSRRHTLLWLGILSITLLLSYLTIGKRLILLLPAICVLLGFHVFRKSLTIRLLPVVLILAVGAGFLSLITRIFLPATIQGYNINLDNVSYADGSIIQFYLFSPEFSTLEMISVAMESRDEIIAMFGSVGNALISTNLSPLLYSVPRALWPDKPLIFYDLSYGISAALGATQFEDPTVGYASTIVGTAYLIGGIIGVIASMLILGVITAAIDTRLSGRTWSDMSIILYALGLVLIFHIFRQGTIGWAFIVSFVQQYGTIGALVALAMASNEKGLIFNKSADRAVQTVPIVASPSRFRGASN